MEKGRSIKVVILFLMAFLSSILTCLDFISIDPVPFVDEIGFGGVTTALWSYFIIAIKIVKKIINKNFLINSL